jgi:hypothetical protein
MNPPMDARSFRVAAILALLAVAPLGAQSASKPSKLLGLIRSEETLEPIAGVDITISPSGPGTMSNERGLFRLDSIPPGQRRIIVRKIGYAPLDTVWTFAPGDSMVRIIELSAIEILDSVVTVEKLRRDPGMDDFEMHRKLGLGHFYTRADIEKSGGRISNLMAMTNGVKLNYGRGNAAYVGSSRGTKSIGGASCLAEVYLDEMNIYSARTSGRPPPFDINSIPSDRIEAIEYYAGASQTPAKYLKLNTDCGVVVIHTRR